MGLLTFHFSDLLKKNPKLTNTSMKASVVDCSSSSGKETNSYWLIGDSLISHCCFLPYMEQSYDEGYAASPHGDSSC